MALNKQDKENIKTALFYLRGGFKDKPEISENKQTESWRGKPPIPILTGTKEYSDYLKDLDKAGDLDDAELLLAFADQVLTYIKNFQPQLLKEIRSQYFNF